MEAKSRVEKALQHQEPDRVPFDLGGTETTGIHIIALKRWLELNGVENAKPEIFTLSTQLGAIAEEHLQRFKVDFRCLKSRAPSSYKMELLRDERYEYFHDEWGIKWQMPLEGGLYYDIGSSPLADKKTVQEIEEYPWPDPGDQARYMHLKGEVDRIRSESRAAIVLERHTGGIFETSWWMRGFENILMDLAAEPGLAAAVMEKVLQQKLGYWEKALEEIKDEVTVVAEADDLASQQGLLMSKGMYRKYLKPLHRRLFSFIKAKAPNARIFYHSCGAIHELIPDLIEAGVDILNPIQVSAANMDTKKLKKTFGKDLVFWGGGVDTQYTLPHGKPEEVRDEVKRRIDDLAPGGGFVFSAVHCIQSDVPPKNIQAMWETLQDYGKY